MFACILTVVIDVHRTAQTKTDSKQRRNEYFSWDPSGSLDSCRHRCSERRHVPGRRYLLFVPFCLCGSLRGVFPWRLSGCCINPMEERNHEQNDPWSRVGLLVCVGVQADLNVPMGLAEIFTISDDTEGAGMGGLVDGRSPRKGGGGSKRCGQAAR